MKHWCLLLFYLLFMVYFLFNFIQTRHTPNPRRHEVKRYTEFLGAPITQEIRNLIKKTPLIELVFMFTYNSEANYSSIDVPYFQAPSRFCPDGKECPVVYLIKRKNLNLYSFLTHQGLDDGLYRLPFIFKSVYDKSPTEFRNYLTFFVENEHFETVIGKESPRRLTICENKHYVQCNDNIRVDLKHPLSKKYSMTLKIIRVAFDHYLLSVILGVNRRKRELICPLPFHYGLFDDLGVFYTPLYVKIDKD